MSIRNLINDNYKPWLSGNFNQLNAKTINVNSGNVIATVVGSAINLQGAPGAIGQVIKKDVSNIPAWTSGAHIFGADDQSFIEYDASTFTTTSVTDVVASTFTTSSLPVGDYLLEYSIEGKNVGGDVSCTLFDGVTALNIFYWPGVQDEYQCFSGFKKLNLTGVNVFTWQTKVITPATTNTLRLARFHLMRVA